MVKEAKQLHKIKAIADPVDAEISRKSKRITRAKTDRKVVDLETRTIADIISNTRTGDPIPAALQNTKLKGPINEKVSIKEPTTGPIAPKKAQPSLIIVGGITIIQTPEKYKADVDNIKKGKQVVQGDDNKTTSLSYMRREKCDRWTEID